MKRTPDPRAGFRLLRPGWMALGPLLGWAALLRVCVAGGGWGAAEDARDAPAPSEPQGSGVIPVPSEAARGSGTERIPEISPEKLPPRTRRKPDPAREAFRAPLVFVRVEERVTPRSGATYEPEVRVTENYIKAYLRRAGHPTVERPEDAAIRVGGEAKLSFHSELTALGRTVGWKYRGEAAFRAIGKDGRDLGSFEIPELYQENVRSEESAVTDARRYLAKIAWDNLYGKGTILGSPRVVLLIGALVIEESDTLGLTESGPSPRTAEGIVSALAGIGFEAVPYLLDAMTDERIVRIPSSYPGLAGRNLEDLKVYHIADKALEEIFQKVSRLDLDTPFRARRVILKGWELEWKRFCPSFADPQGPDREERSPKDAATP